MRGSLLAAAAGAALAATRAPIRGWNSWDTYVNWNGDQSSGNIPEADIPAAAQWMAANLLPYGFDTFVVDEGWYWDGSNEVVDAYGRPTPNPAVYPSASDGRGFKTLSDQIHALGLKFGACRGAQCTGAWRLRHAAMYKLPYLHYSPHCPPLPPPACRRVDPPRYPPRVRRRQRAHLRVQLHRRAGAGARQRQLRVELAHVRHKRA